MHMNPFSPKPPPIQAATYHWSEFHVLYSMSLLVIRFKHSRVYVSIPNSRTIPFAHPSPLATIKKKNELTSDACYSVDELQQHAQWKKVQMTAYY